MRVITAYGSGVLRTANTAAGKLCGNTILGKDGSARPGPVATLLRVLRAGPSRRSAYVTDGASAGVTEIEDCILVPVALSSDSITARRAAMLYVDSDAKNTMP